MKREKIIVGLISSVKGDNTDIFSHLKEKSVFVKHFTSFDHLVNSSFIGSTILLRGEKWEHVFEEVRQHNVYCELPVILLTDKSSFQNQLHAMEKGIFSCVDKKDISGIVIQCLSAKQMYRLKHEISSLNRRLSTNYLVLDAKNKCLEGVIEKLDMVMINESIDNRSNEILSQLIKEVHSNLKNEYQLELFKVHFEEVHPLFFKKLLSINKELTNNNLRLAAFVKMGFENKEIAFISNLALSSVKKSIQRLKYKLHIKPDASLRDFINGIGY